MTVGAINSGSCEFVSDFNSTPVFYFDHLSYCSEIKQANIMQCSVLEQLHEAQ